MNQIRELQEVVLASWRREKPLVETHVGDLAWWSREPDARRNVWHAAGEPVAWGWLSPPGELDFHVRADRRGDGLEEEVLVWFEREAATETLGTWALDADGPKLATLDAAGYFAQPGAGFLHLVRTLEAPVEPTLPNGYRLGHVTDDDVARRVAVQRASFASTMTEEKYVRLRRTWPYREELDVVVEAPNGSLAAFCLAWLDEENRVGELEPVGTHPEHRRRGLAQAACLEALRRLRELTADTCVVYAVERADYAGPLALYTGLGFEPRARHIRLERSRS